MHGYTMPVKINDNIIEEAARAYRLRCEQNDVLIHNDRIITFEYFLSLYLIFQEIGRIFISFDRQGAQA